MPQTLLLQALRAALCGTTVPWTEPLTEAEWTALFQMAERHRILPLVFEAVYACPAAQAADPALLRPYKQRTIQLVLLQTLKGGQFLAMYRHLLDGGVAPIVVKGAICRSLFPQPDHRLSGDEDLLVLPEDFAAFDRLMLDFGMDYADPTQNRAEAYEIPYGKPGSPLYIEAHKSLFPPQSQAYGDLNRCFARAHQRTITVTLDGVPVRTLGYTDHLLYLICHAFKHFLHSGFGIRQVCDIVLMANAHGQEVDWHSILRTLETLHADRFAAALFRIGGKYLTFDPVQAAYPAEWQAIPVDEGPLLEDLLSGGIYGATDADRAHSSTLTLNAVAADRQGRVGRLSPIKSLFPPAADLTGRYPYLTRRPWLLPFAWLCRLAGYVWELLTGRKKSSGLESLRIGEQRLALFRLYGIIK